MKFVVTENPESRWDLFVAQHTDLIFYTSTWGEVLRQGLCGQPCTMTLEDKNGIVCGLPGIILKRCGIKFLYCTIPYGGYVGPLNFFYEFMEQLLRWAKSFDIIYATPFMPQGKDDYNKYFTAMVEKATRIDLHGKSLNEIQSAFDPSVRYSINKGHRLELKVHKRCDRESFLKGYQLYLQTMSRNRAIPKYGESWFQALFEIMACQGKAFAFVASQEGLPISTTIVVNSPSGYHLLHSGSSTEHLSLRANDLVASEVIKDAVQQNKEYVDLMLSDPFDKPLIRWKEKFGGKTIILNKFYKVNSPVKHALWNKAKQIYPFIKYGKMESRV